MDIKTISDFQKKKTFWFNMETAEKLFSQIGDEDELITFYRTDCGSYVMEELSSNDDHIYSFTDLNGMYYFTLKHKSENGMGWFLTSEPDFINKYKV